MSFIPNLKDKRCYAACPEYKIKARLCDCHNRLEMHVQPEDNWTQIVASQFCPKCSPHTWGNIRVQIIPPKQQCGSCGYLWESDNPDRGSFESLVKAHGLQSTTAREAEGGYLVVGQCDWCQDQSSK